ncbi:MAG: hypothetical protein QXE01_11155 [Sulfolobales archaeon]
MSDNVSSTSGKKGLRGLLSRLNEAIYGMALHGQVTAIMKEKMYIEYLFMLMTIGDMMGIPILPPYYTLRLLPYMVPNIKGWKLRMLRERDFTDIVTG